MTKAKGTGLEPTLHNAVRAEDGSVRLAEVTGHRRAMETARTRSHSTARGKEATAPMRLPIHHRHEALAGAEAVEFADAEEEEEEEQEPPHEVVFRLVRQRSLAARSTTRRTKMDTRSDMIRYDFLPYAANEKV